MKTIKYIFYIKAVLIFIASIPFISCTKEEEIQTEFYNKPGQSALALPENNTECEYGEVVANKAEVFFEWQASSATEKYDLEITNLVTSEVVERLLILGTLHQKIQEN